MILVQLINPLTLLSNYHICYNICYKLINFYSLFIIVRIFIEGPGVA